MKPNFLPVSTGDPHGKDDEANTAQVLAIVLQRLQNVPYRPVLFTDPDKTQEELFLL